MPREFVTDNITFISCDFADVRPAYVHDVACKYHELFSKTFENDCLKDKTPFTHKIIKSISKKKK